MNKIPLNEEKKRYFSLISFHLDNFDLQNKDFELYDNLIDSEFNQESEENKIIKSSIRTYASMFMDFRIIKIKDDWK